MNSLREIEIAADALPPEEKQALVLFLVTRLRESGAEIPPPRDIPLEKLQEWIKDDEDGYRRFLAKS